MTIRSGVEGRTGRVRLKGDALTELRQRCFDWSGGRCVECGRLILWATFEMAHIQGRGANGSDKLSNLRALCGRCHNDEHHPKAIARKRKL